MDKWVFDDGRVVPDHQVDVRWDAPGFRQGYGLFETIRVAAGRGFLMGMHARRMTEAAPSLGIDPWLHPRTLTRGLDRLVERTGAQEGALRVFLMPASSPPGEDPAEGTPSPGQPLLLRARYLGSVSPGRPPHPVSARAVLAPDLRDAISPLVGLKTISYAAERLLLARARKQGADESVRRNLAGRVTEGTRSNLFLIEGNRLITPPVSEGLLPGVTRWLVLRVARDCGLDPSEEPVSVERLMGADEAVLTSTLRGIVPLISLDGKPIGSGAPGQKSIRFGQMLEKLITRGREPS